MQKLEAYLKDLISNTYGYVKMEMTILIYMLCVKNIPYISKCLQLADKNCPQPILISCQQHCAVTYNKWSITFFCSQLLRLFGLLDIGKLF